MVVTVILQPSLSHSYYVLIGVISLVYSLEYLLNPITLVANGLSVLASISYFMEILSDLTGSAESEKERAVCREPPQNGASSGKSTFKPGFKIPKIFLHPKSSF